MAIICVAIVLGFAFMQPSLEHWATARIDQTAGDGSNGIRIHDHEINGLYNMLYRLLSVWAFVLKSFLDKISNTTILLYPIMGEKWNYDIIGPDGIILFRASDF